MQILKQFFRLAAPFWLRKSQWREWLLLGVLLALTLFVIRISVWIAQWDKRFYDALAAYDGKSMPALAAEYLGYMGLIVGCIVCGGWLQKKIIFRWREYLSQYFQNQWLAGHRHYRLKFSGEPDNPDQRIAEDIRLLAEQSTDLLRSFAGNAAKLGAFVAVLWNLSGRQTFHFGSYALTLDGYLVWAALAYSVFSTLLAHFVSRRLKNLNIERQHREADYRAALLRIRDHGEQIAFYCGGGAERNRLEQRFSRIRDNWRRLVNCEFRQETFWALYVRIGIFIPIIATLPMYLAHTLTFGDMMQTRTAFSRVQDSFGWFTDVYRRLVEWAAVVERLAGFQTALQQAGADFAPSEKNSGTAPAQNRSAAALPSPLLAAEDLSVDTAGGVPLLAHLGFTVRPSEWLLVDGKSGIGKSTLLRTLAGLWPYYRGGFRLGGKALFLPQQPYLPQDSLRRTVAYPYEALPDDGALGEILRAVGLEHLSVPYDQEQEWHACLAGGEQQRLSLARVLFHRPPLLFLDEATNQLDDEAARKLMRLLKQRLPDTAVVGISHQTAVRALFEKTLPLQASLEKQKPGL